MYIIYNRMNDDIVVKSFADFLEKCFMLDPAKRLTPQDALRHPFLDMSN